MKILFCQLRSYGDIIRTFPAIKAIRKLYPNAFLAFTCIEEMEQAVLLCEDLDKIYLQPRLLANEKHVGHTRIVDTSPLEKTIMAVREHGFDYYIDFQGVFQSALFGMLANIPERVGPHVGKDGAYLYYNHHYKGQWRGINRMERHLKVVQTIFPDITVQSTAKKPVFPNEKPVIIIAPGTSNIGKYKRWPADYYSELIDKIRNQISAEIHIVCSLGEKEIGEKIFESAGKETCSLVICESFQDAKEKILKAQAFIGGDSAYTHIATVGDIPSFMILGPTPPSENVPWPHVINGYAYSNISCSPCNLWDQKCSNDVQCMKTLTSDLIYKELQVFLQKVFF
jgi:ADP-heptose:LPS heptosyltransferase